MIFLITIIILILLLIIYFAVGNYFYNIALNPKKDKTFIFGGPLRTDGEKKSQEENMQWFEENSENINITSTHNGKINLHAYEMKNALNHDNTWIITIHGYMSEGNNLLWITPEFYRKGYNLLIPDLRGHGFSEGNYIGMGWHDRLDIIDWINYLIKKYPDCKIILWGVSMGAATTMMVTGEDLPENVKFAIADCGYTSAWDEFKYQLKTLFHLPAFPILYAANTITKIRAGYSLKEASAIEQVKKSKTPTLFIHGGADTFVPFKMLDEIYEAANCKKEKLIIEEAGHGMSKSVNPDLYWKKVDEFIK